MLSCRSRKAYSPTNPVYQVPTHNSGIATSMSPATTSTSLNFLGSSGKQSIPPAPHTKINRSTLARSRKSVMFQGFRCRSQNDSDCNGEQLHHPLYVPHLQPDNQSLRVQTSLERLAPHFMEYTPEDSPFPSEAQKRRRKMDKVVRILGESVPPELVFPTTPTEVLMMEFVNTTWAIPDIVVTKSSTPDKDRESSHRRASASHLSLAYRKATVPRPSTASRLETTSFFSSQLPTKVVSPSDDKHRTINRERHTNTSPSSYFPQRPHPRTVPRPSTASRLETSPFMFTLPDEGFGRKQRPWALVTTTYGTHSLDHLSNPDAPFHDSHCSGSSDCLTVAPHDENVRDPSIAKKFRGWSGEWNRDDMQDVINKLRLLK